MDGLLKNIFIFIFAFLLTIIWIFLPGIYNLIFNILFLILCERIIKANSDFLKTKQKLDLLDEERRQRDFDSAKKLDN